MAECFVKTRCAELKKGASENFVLASYKAPKKKSAITNQRTSDDSGLTSAKLSEEKDSVVDLKRKQELEMKRVRYEVIKFGMSGFDKPKARQAKMDLAIKLGAKPPRNRRQNYKQLKAERRKEKEEAKKEEQSSGLNKAVMKKQVRRRPNKKQSGILNLYGKVQKEV